MLRNFLKNDRLLRIYMVTKVGSLTALIPIMNQKTVIKEVGNAKSGNGAPRKLSGNPRTSSGKSTS